MPRLLWGTIPKNIFIVCMVLCIIGSAAAFADDEQSTGITFQPISRGENSLSVQSAPEWESPAINGIDHESAHSMVTTEESGSGDASQESAQSLSAIESLNCPNYADTVDFMAAPDFMDLASGDLSKDEPQKAAPKKKRDWKVLVGDWNESNFPMNKGDFNFYFTQISYKKLHARYDLFTGTADRFRRYWLHYGALPLITNPDFKLSITPGAMILNDSKAKGAASEAFYGGMVTVEFPKIKLTVQDRSYIGDGGLGRWGLHYVFTDLGVAKWLNLSHVWWKYQNALPASYLGPKVLLKSGESFNFFGMYGFSIYDARPDARFIYTGVTFSF